MGYRVYMGPCTVNNSGNLVWAKKVLLADVSKANAVNDPTETSTCYIIDPVLTLSKNSIGTFDFTLPHSTIVSSEYQEMIKSCGGSTTYTAKVEYSGCSTTPNGVMPDGAYIYTHNITIKVPSANAANTKVTVTNLLHNYSHSSTDEDDDGNDVTTTWYGDECISLTSSYTISGSGQISITITTYSLYSTSGVHGFTLPHRETGNKAQGYDTIAKIDISNTIDGKEISSTINFEARGETYGLNLLMEWNAEQTSSVTAEVTRSDITYASNVALKKLRVMIYDVDNDTEDVKSIVWVGYVSSTIIQFDRSIDVTCDEIIGVLQDGVVQLLKSSGTINLTDVGTSVFAQCINNYGTTFSGSEPSYYDPPFINRGTVTMLSGKTLDLEEKGSVYGVAWDVLNSYLIDEYDGYLRPRYELQTDGSIKTYLDYLSDITDTTSQTIEYGVNLTDMTYEEKYPSDFANHIVASVEFTTTKGFWIFKSSSTNLVTVHAQDEDSIAKYGMVTKRIMPSDASTQTALQTACDEELEKYTQDIEPTITVKAIDCMDIDGESATDRLGFLKKTHIISSPHGIDVTLVCTKATIYLNKPDKCTYTFGYAPKKLTDQQNSVTSTSSTTSNTTGAVVSYLNSKT